MKKAIVVGGLNLDICGLPDGELVPRDSNIGRVEMRAGGVGHNIAARLAQLGVEVELVTAIGDDAAAVMLREQLRREGVGVSLALQMHGPSCCYVSLHDADGDMAAAVNAMALMERFTPEDLPLDAINACGLCIADTNLPPAVLHALAERARIPLMLDTVSCAKVERACGVIGRFYAVKPNAAEAAMLSGESDPARAAAWFLAQGTEHVFISLGARGVYAAGKSFFGFLPAPKLSVRNATGAGDAMAAGIASALLEGLDTRSCALRGMETASRYLSGHQA